MRNVLSSCPRTISNCQKLCYGFFVKGKHNSYRDSVVWIELSFSAIDLQCSKRIH